MTDSSRERLARRLEEAADNICERKNGRRSRMTIALGRRTESEM
jgi:hypothetical protein